MSLIREIQRLKQHKTVSDKIETVISDCVIAEVIPAFYETPDGVEETFFVKVYKETLTDLEISIVKLLILYHLNEEIVKVSKDDFAYTFYPEDSLNKEFIYV